VTDKSDSSLVRMLSVLELFDEHRLSWSAEEIADALQVSVPTSYRYVRVLVAAGLLQRAAGPHYTLGPRIIIMDHYIRLGDPMLQHSQPLMKELVEQTGLDCVLSGLYGLQVLDTHRESGSQPVALRYGRGRPRSLFVGAAPKAILSRFTPAQLRKMFDGHAGEITAAGLPAEWKAFRSYFGAIRKAGHYFSNGELEPNVAGVAAPIQKTDGTILGAISLVTSVQRMAIVDLPKIVALVMRAGREISARIR